MITKILWWIWQIILALAACFFLVFGIQMLIASYSLNDPFTFIMTFFSSSLIILISATLLFSFVYKMISRRKNEPDQGQEPGDRSQEPE
jgi:membrane protein implicated in regulation of membrane protease activity